MTMTTTNHLGAETNEITTMMYVCNCSSVLDIHLTF